MYGIPILAVLVVLPAEQVTSLGGLIDAMKTVFTVYGGSVAADGSVALSGAGQLLGWASALVFIWVLMASGAAWIMGAGRAQAAACMDGAGPRALGRISARTGVPVVMGLVSGAVSLGAMAASLWITRGDGQKYFSAALTVSIALIVLAYLLIYPAFLALRVRRPDLERPFLAPGGPAGAWLITILATGWSLLVTACLLWPGLGTADPDAALPAASRASASSSSSSCSPPWPWCSPPAPSSTWPAAGPHDLRAASGSVTNPATSATTAGSRRIR
jgi:glutamate:GABA antiporter